MKNLRKKPRFRLFGNSGLEFLWMIFRTNRCLLVMKTFKYECKLTKKLFDFFGYCPILHVSNINIPT